MKQTIRYGIIISCIFMLHACNQKASLEASTEIADIIGQDSDPNRQVIKTATASLNVKDVNAYVDSMSSILKDLDGHISYLDFKSNERIVQTVHKSVDSILVQKSIEPLVSFKARIPSHRSKEFVSFLLKSDARIENLLIEEEDITEKIEIGEKESNLETSKQLNQAKADEASFERNNAISKIQQQAMVKTLKYKSSYQWFDISVKGETSYEQEIKADISDIRTPFGVEIQRGLLNGWSIFKTIFISLMNIWPFIGLIIFGFILYRSSRIRRILASRVIKK